MNGELKRDTDVVKVRGLDALRWHSPNPKFIMHRYERRYWIKTRDGMTGEVWIDGHIQDTGIFIPNDPIIRAAEAR